LIGIERKTEVLGSGAFTTVSAEWDPLLGHAVAVKELNSPFAQSEAFVRAFLAKARRLFDLDHEHVLAVYRVDTSRQAPAVVRELAGETLESTTVAGPVSPARAEEILGQALLGLQAMHERNLIHGAIKPQNLFLFGDRVKIGDFGLASLPGTPTAPMNRYMPPEVLRGEAAVPASDLYSLGLVVYELLLGKTRFEQLARGELAPLHELVPGVPAALSSAVEQMTRRAVAYRVGEAKQVLGLLGASSSQGTPSSPPLFTGLSSLNARLRPAVPKPALDVKKLKRGLAIALAVVLAGLAISTILFLRSQSPSGGSVTAPKTDPAKPAADTSPNGPAATAAEVPPEAAPPATTDPEDSPVVDSSVPLSAEPPSVPTAPRQVPVKTAIPTPATAPLQNQRDASAIVSETPVPSQASDDAAPEKRIPSGREVIFELEPSRYNLGTIHKGQRAYVDLDAVYTDLPERHDHLPCIQTAISDRDKNGTISFDLSRNARVYIGHDRSIKRKPAWLREFHPTDETWSVLARDAEGSLSTMIYFDVYTRSYPAGVVSLGPNMENRLFSMVRSLGVKYLGKGEPGMYLVCVDAR